MNCNRCGIKISPTLAKEQDPTENLCRDCYGWKRARENQEAIERRKRGEE